MIYKTYKKIQNGNGSAINGILIFVLLFFYVSIMYAQKFVVEEGMAFFKAEISLNSYTGKSEQLRGQIDFQTGLFEFILPAKSIKTGIERRDIHMYELLKVEQYSKVIFKGKLIGEFDWNKMEKQIRKVKGYFTLAGSSKEIILDISLIPEKKGLRLSANWSILISDYHLEPPSIMFFKVKDNHKIGINALLIEK